MILYELETTVKSPILYVDMDGVLTEYYNAIATFATSQGLLESGGDWYDMSPEIELQAIAAVPNAGFFANLAVRAEANALIDLCVAKNGSYRALTTDAGTQANTIKTNWMAANFTGSRAAAGIDFATNFKDIIEKGGIVKAIPAPNTFSKPRSFFDGLNNWAISEGASGLAYITFEKSKNKIVGKGPIAKFFSESAVSGLMKSCKINEKDSVFFVCNKEKEATKFSGIARQKIGEELKLIDEKSFQFCWVIDYPMYEYDEKEKKIDFSHNPFSMPQVEIKDFDGIDPLKILAYQYDLVCNGYELSSGAIRNHMPEYLFKVFEKVGYSKNMVEKNFSGMIKALSYGAPPHGGMAPGIDRIVMLLANQKNIREVTLFPLNQNAEDLLMEAPSDATEKQLKELNIKTIKKS